ncbi:hypothetical protein SDC9_100605 [bioreactor metagenome]|uniref:Uncharacterized protein n=1 Tax=bioreactor metagenome TaxID=1076179 RepID=A0A645AKT4_9ZZZZ
MRCCKGHRAGYGVIAAVWHGGQLSGIGDVVDDDLVRVFALCEGVGKSDCRPAAAET